MTAPVQLFAEQQEVSPTQSEEQSKIQWLLWGEEAFQRAEAEDKLILMDLTALWCHACHVMEETTYADPDIIAMLNDRFVPIRVDTDLRPDIEARYRKGGWPTTSILLPTGEILFQANSLDPEDLSEALQESDVLYRTQKQDLVRYAGSYAYLGHGDQGLEIIDISRPAAPAVVNHWDAAGKSRGVHVVGAYAYLANGYKGLRILDVSDPAAPHEIGQHPTYRALLVHVSGSHAYVADGWAGIRVLDVSNPSLLREVGHRDTPGAATGITVSGTVAYVADGPAGLRVLDVSKPDAPRDISAYDTPGYAYSVRIAGEHAYVADGEAGLRIIEVSNPAAPKEIGRYVPPKGDVRGVAIVGSYAYLAAGYTAGFQVIDISDPTHPRAVGHYDTPRSARNVFVTGAYAYVGDLEWVRVLDVSTPSAPREIASYKTPSYADDIWVANGTVYVAAYDSGLIMLGLTRKENLLSGPQHGVRHHTVSGTLSGP